MTKPLSIRDRELYQHSSTRIHDTRRTRPHGSLWLGRDSSAHQMPGAALAGRQTSALVQTTYRRNGERRRWNRLLIFPTSVGMHRLIVFQKYKLNTFLSTVYPRRQALLKHRSGRKIMSIKIGDKIRYIATSEDGEVVGASELSPGCVLVRFGASLEYLIEKDRLSLIAGGPLRIPVIHR